LDEDDEGYEFPRGYTSCGALISSIVGLFVTWWWISGLDVGGRRVPRLPAALGLAGQSALDEDALPKADFLHGLSVEEGGWSLPPEKEETKEKEETEADAEAAADAADEADEADADAEVVEPLEVKDLQELGEILTEQQVTPEEEALAQATADRGTSREDRAIHAIVWALDVRTHSEQRAFDSLRTVIKATEAAAAKGQPETAFAYVFLLVDDGRLNCAGAARRGSTLSCSEFRAVPSDVANCSLVESPERGLKENHLHLMSLPSKDWKGVFVNTLDKFAREVAAGQLAGQQKRKRHDLVFSHANHIRFVLDYVFLQFGIEQALWLDSDTCVVGRHSVFPLFQTRGNKAVVAAYRTDSDGKVVQISKGENLRNGESFVKDLNFHGSFNAGVVLFRIKALCQYQLLEKMIKIQQYHNTKKRLWTAGINQPSFELAASKSLSMVSPHWNCRLQSDLLPPIRKYGVTGAKSAVRKWAGACRIFHPAMHDMGIKDFNCSAFHR